MSGRRLNWLWLPSLLGMLVAVPLALYGLMMLFGSVGRRVDGLVPLVVAFAIVALSMRGLGATDASGRTPVRASRRSRRTAIFALGVFAILVGTTGWRAWSYQGRCDDVRAELRDAVLSEVGVLPEPKAVAALGAGRRACEYAIDADPALVESRTNCRVGVEARIWRWLFWEASPVASQASYVSVDDGSVVELIFRR